MVLLVPHLPSILQKRIGPCSAIPGAEIPALATDPDVSDSNSLPIVSNAGCLEVKVAHSRKTLGQLHQRGHLGRQSYEPEGYNGGKVADSLLHSKAVKDTTPPTSPCKQLALTHHRNGNVWFDVRQLLRRASLSGSGW